MLDITAYYKDDSEILLDEQYDIVTNSAGHYRLIRRSWFGTCRPEGREDYQILYVAKGKAVFVLNGQHETVTEGHAVLYIPGVHQEYEYRLEDAPDIYWVHFTGRQANSLLAECGFHDQGVYPVGIHNRYLICWQNIIRELQLKPGGFERLTSVYMEELLRLMGRYLKEYQTQKPARNKSVDQAIFYFHENYREDISIHDYAASGGLSVCWFIRSFKAVTGMTPQKYITEIRIRKAKELLADRFYQVGEVAGIVGYSNPLYFSRIFKKYTGISPSRYAGGGKARGEKDQ